MLTALRGRVALAAVKRGLPARMAADSVAKMPDGLHAAIAGAGSPLPDPRRGNPCVAVIAGKRMFIVDAGEGASETLNRMQIDPERHRGRAADPLPLRPHRRPRQPRHPALGRPGASATPMRVLGPPGVERVVAGYNEAYAMDSGYRTAHHGEAILPSGGRRLAAEPFAMPDGDGLRVVLQDGDLTVTAFTVDHTPAEPAVGYRFDYKGRSLVVSGDTALPRVLVRAAKGADLLIHDALSRELLKLAEDAARDAGLTARAKIFSDLPTTTRARRRRPTRPGEAGVRALVLTHIVPPLPLKGLEGPFLGDAARAVHRPALDRPRRRPVQPGGSARAAVERSRPDPARPRRVAGRHGVLLGERRARWHARGS